VTAEKCLIKNEDMMKKICVAHVITRIRDYQTKWKGWKISKSFPNIIYQVKEIRNTEEIEKFLI
jgi:hypothetical protein